MPELEPEPTPEAAPRRRLSALDSEALAIDDRLLRLERDVRAHSDDLYIVRDVMVSELVAIALLELAVIGLVLAVMVHLHKRGEEVGPHASL